MSFTPVSNDISERKHNSKKTLAARERCSVAEAAYCYNVLPRSDDQASNPMETLFNYWVRVSDVAVPADADIAALTSETECEQRPEPPL